MSSPIEPLRLALAGRYEFDRELERADTPATLHESCTTYRARDLRNGDQVWLAVVDPARVPKGDVARVRTALVRPMRVQHPWLALPTEIGEDAGLLWFAIPIPEGESLRARLARDRTLSVEEAVQRVRSAAQALQYAHEEKLAHGALTIDSIILTPDGACVLTDVGMARALLGVAEGHPLDDQRALAAVAVEMLTGSAPELSSSTTIPSVRARRAELPAALDAALQRALSPDRTLRFPCAADFELAIRPPVEAMPRRWSTTTRLVGALLLVTILAVSAVGLWMVSRVASEGSRAPSEPMAAPR